MNETPSDQPDERPATTPNPVPVDQNLTQQLADCQQQLQHVKITLAEAQRVLAQHRRLEDERNRLLEQERQLNELKSNFVLLASHEFRTPMMTILSSASLIGRYTSPVDVDKRERHVQRIKTAVGSLTSMLNDFLAISQMDQQALTAHPQPLEIIPFCREVITDAQVLARPRQRFQYQHTNGPIKFLQDGQLIKPILLNLLTNASKYSAEDADIYLTTTTHGSQLQITVTDQGIGIPDTDKDKLFINFFRGRNAIHVQGTGLGLYLVKRYVDLLEGSISFTSQVGEGTIFSVQLPITPLPQ
ncbi:sensor histidine kinase [Spirosoma sp. HMF4905]|uniref:histidine kinase n=1 Tax=Spirosoma arboris TaxID=2682092 RepID=A0A7K1SEC7_9BACT|nr:HAMP domain-containing sensor histidine kinase [Spirosoma arboris]MVM32141.1 sensor histidine kinase [Spirosoma arboris]